MEQVFISPFLLPDTDPRPPPIIHEGPQNQTLPLRSQAMLRCKATGDPPPTIKWLRNHRPVLEENANARFMLLDSGTLQISGMFGWI